MSNVWKRNDYRYGTDSYLKEVATTVQSIGVGGDYSTRNLEIYFDGRSSENLKFYKPGGGEFAAGEAIMERGKKYAF